MARKPATAKAAVEEEVKASESRALTNWQEEMAREAEIAMGREANAGGGSFFSTQGGILQFNGVAMPDNQMAVIVLEHILENVYYDGIYDPDNPAPPTCFAYAEDEEGMAPHETVVERDQAQNETCAGCPMNKFGTAERGKGKACRNTRRLALLSAGSLTASGAFTPIKNTEEIKKGEMGLLKLPVTSVKGWAAYVKKIGATFKRPPAGVFTKIKVVPDAKTQFKVLFEPLSLVDDEFLEDVFARRREAKEVLTVPYALDFEEAEEKPAPAAKGRGTTNTKPKTRGKKY